MGSVKYSKYLQATTKNYRTLRFSRLDHAEAAPRTSINYTLHEALTIIRPYVKVRLYDQFKVVIPIALYLILFQLIVMKQSISGGFSIALGLFGVVTGLMFFMEGLKVGLMPFGEAIGYYLPMKAKKSVLLVIAFALGVGATFAEPSIGVLKEAGKIVDPERAPLLFDMLNRFAGFTVLAVSIGVGVATLLGILMFIHGWSLKKLIYFSLTPTLILTAYCFTDDQLAQVIGLAWDCGAVTTGPVTVPLILSLGIGVAGVIKHKHTNNIPGFGLVTLASLFPIMAVLVLAIILREVAPASIAAASVAGDVSWFDAPAVQSVVLSIRAIVPLALFLLFVLYVVLKERIPNIKEVIYGLTLCLVGMSLFNLGLNFGLSPLGSLVGSIVPASYSELPAIAGSPLYGALLGLIICVVFAFFLGYGATLAEPALNALGLTVENLTNGAFKKKLVMLAVSLGVAMGLAVGVLKIVYNIPAIALLLPLYLLAIVLTFLAEEKYVNMGWDSAGVTTGPITVPLVLAMGLGFANATNAVDGFGLLALASIFPILSVLSVGLFVHHLQAKTQKEESYV